MGLRIDAQSLPAREDHVWIQVSILYVPLQSSETVFIYG